MPQRLLPAVLRAMRRLAGASAGAPDAELPAKALECFLALLPTSAAEYDAALWGTVAAQLEAFNSELAAATTLATLSKHEVAVRRRPPPPRARLRARQTKQNTRTLTHVALAPSPAVPPPIACPSFASR